MRKFAFVVIASVLACASWLWLRPGRVEGGNGTLVFPLSVRGVALQTDIDAGPGFKPNPGKINDKTVGAVLRGELPDFAADFLDLDPDGRFYLYFDGRQSDGSTSWRIATNPDGKSTTTFTGAMTQDGFFWLSGEYVLPTLMGEVGDVFLFGKATFAKDTFTPTKIGGTCVFVSSAIGEAFTVKFKTAGGPIE
jgi:hypothetical protein